MTIDVDARRVGDGHGRSPDCSRIRSGGCRRIDRYESVPFGGRARADPGEFEEFHQIDVGRRGMGQWAKISFFIFANENYVRDVDRSALLATCGACSAAQGFGYSSAMTAGCDALEGAITWFAAPTRRSTLTKLSFISGLLEGEPSRRPRPFGKCFG